MIDPLAVIITAGGAVISALVAVCTTLILRGQKHQAEQVAGTHRRIDLVSLRLHHLNNWCCYLAGRNGWEPPVILEGRETK